MNGLAKFILTTLASAALAGPVCVAAQESEALAPGSPAPPAATVAATQASPAAAAVEPLDLRAPDVTKLFSEHELQRVLAEAVDPEIEEVEVERARERAAPLPDTPTVWPGLLAPFWALAHPTQAWRILAPLPPDQARRVNATVPSATDPYRPAQPLP